MKSTVTAALVYTFVVSVCRAVTITSLSVPRSVPANTSSIVLDCVYNVPEGMRKGLVVKWYVDGVHLVYQWIPPQDPQALGVLSGRVDTTYMASMDSWAKYRAIHLTKLDPTLSGDYSCTVSTYEDEDTRTEPMLIWAPAASVNVNYWRPSEYLVNITCSATDVAPKPQFTIYTLFPDRTRSNVGVRGRMHTYKGGGMWDAGTWGLIEYEHTPLNTVVGCIVSHPHTKYRAIQEKYYSPDLPIITTTTTTPRPRRYSNIANNGPTTASGLLDLSSLFGSVSRADRNRVSRSILQSLTLLILGVHQWQHQLYFVNYFRVL